MLSVAKNKISGLNSMSKMLLASLNACSLVESDTFSHEFIQGDRFERLVFKNVIFDSCCFYGVDFTYCHFQDCSFKNVVFENCRFTGGSQTGTDFSMCSLTDCAIDCQAVADVRMSACTYTEITFRGSVVTGLKFEDCDVAKVVFFRSTFSGVSEVFLAVLESLGDHDDDIDFFDVGDKLDQLDISIYKSGLSLISRFSKVLRLIVLLAPLAYVTLLVSFGDYNSLLSSLRDSVLSYFSGVHLVSVFLIGVMCTLVLLALSTYLERVLTLLMSKKKLMRLQKRYDV